MTIKVGWLDHFRLRDVREGHKTEPTPEPSRRCRDSHGWAFRSFGEGQDAINKPPTPAPSSSCSAAVACAETAKVRVPVGPRGGEKERDRVLLPLFPLILPLPPRPRAPVSALASTCELLIWHSFQLVED